MRAKDGLYLQNWLVSEVSNWEDINDPVKPLMADLPRCFSDLTTAFKVPVEIWLDMRSSLAGVKLVV